MKYADYLTNISQKFRHLLEDIQTEYNFDKGDEFEIAICKALRIILPERFGVCRGFLVTVNGKRAGDDIVVYDRMRFPTLRLRTDEDFSQKERIPIEAGYAYIEAKHSLVIEGSEQNFTKAIKQVRDVKALPRNLWKQRIVLITIFLFQSMLKHGQIGQSFATHYSEQYLREIYVSSLARSLLSLL